MWLFIYFGFCLFLFFFFSFPFNIFFQEIFKGTGTPRCVRQQCSAGAGCPRDVWSWSAGTSGGALASQGVGQISGSSFGATRGGKVPVLPGVPCCPQGHFRAPQLCPEGCIPQPRSQPSTPHLRFPHFRERR